jgi:NADH:ubiquinone oxidoreductase subunit F (NADH-binding)
VEGIAIAALAVGAREAIIAVRAEYADAVAALEAAVFAAEEAGFLGRDVLRSGRDVAVTVRTVQGAYMLGEETVLIAALEGRRGQPEQRPPYPTERGLWGHPTLVHNVATLASLPWIVTNGADPFRAIGDPDAPGTVLVGISGAVASPGIVEVPTGTTLRELVDLAGGVAAGHTFKAALVGGPTGGLLPSELLDTPYSFDALRATGAHVGSGGVVVADERACVVDLARLLVRYAADEACGKTIPCRIGLRRLAEIGQRYVDGTARPGDPKLLADLADDCAASALCDHERLASAPLRTAMRYFGPEIDDHILRGTCPAGVCSPIALPAAATGR